MSEQPAAALSLAQQVGVILMSGEGEAAGFRAWETSGDSADTIILNMEDGRSVRLTAVDQPAETVLPYRPMPADFPETFVRLGFCAKIEKRYHVSTSTIVRWAEHLTNQAAK